MANSLNILKIDNQNILSYKVKLLQSFKYHPDLNRATRERGLLEEVIKLVQKNKTILYLLKDSDNYLGIIALSASSIDDAPVVQIDYLFVDYHYRKKYIDSIDNTISKYLIMYATYLAEKLKQDIGIKYLALYPDAQSDKLILHYKDIGFEQLNKHWLFIKLK